ncbi:UPF0175 family protein [Candidatus Woesearchaeota archaeon]|nr:UPF0175 family protein [Candidatus Woesearchaeota archaeon]MBI2130216.1 UPF0175 family protein [Candidatus Woesearchaeota archaeon]
MTTTISTRLQKKEAREIEKFAKSEDLDKSTFVKRLINRSLQEYKVEHAFKLYREGKVSLWKAAELADKSLWEMIGLMKKYDVYLNCTADDLREDLLTIKGIG